LIYNSIVLSKTNHQVPLFVSNKPMHSKYNPINEASSFGKDNKSNFFIIGGIGGGFHLQSLLQNNKNCFIIAVEDDKQSLDFCLSLNENNNLLHNNRIALCTIDDLLQTIQQTYLPALYGNLSILYWRTWQAEIPEAAQNIQKIVQKSLTTVSADYSVQTYFGKLWHHNILRNIDFLENKQFSLSQDTIKKGVSIIAAGPSLDTTINHLKQNKESTTIFATDTTTKALADNNIIPDFIVSVDSQRISATHFTDVDERFSKTIFLFDLSANTSLIYSLKQKGLKVFFITTGHPLSKLIQEKTSIPYITSGAGTVTIAAIEAARYLGFNKFTLYGADFSYNSGKAYTKGTYLDKNFNTLSLRLNPSETSFDALMFRTPLFEPNKSTLFTKQLINPKTSTVMDSYKQSLITWINENNGIINDTTITIPSQKLNTIIQNPLNKQGFIKKYVENINPKLFDKEIILNKYLIASLPYIAWCRKYKKEEEASLQELITSVYHQTQRYIKDYEN